MLDEIITWWSRLQPNVQAALIGAGATVTAATIGALVVARQIRKQAANAIRQNSHNEALKLKLKVYEEIIEVVQRCQDASSSLSSFVRVFSVGVQLARNACARAQRIVVPDGRAPVFLDLQKSFAQSAVMMVFLTERWQIIDPRIEVFRTAFNSALHDVRSAYTKYVKIAVELMPVVRPDGQSIFPWSPPDDLQFAALDQAGKSLIEAVDKLASFAYDFQGEMQNLLVGELFGKQVPPRASIDPSYPVIRLEHHAKLEAYFLTDTAWGRSKTKVEEEVRKGLDHVQA